jgi:hypothetical protein
MYLTVGGHAEEAESEAATEIAEPCIGFAAFAAN